MRRHFGGVAVQFTKFRFFVFLPFSAIFSGFASFWCVKKRIILYYYISLCLYGGGITLWPLYGGGITISGHGITFPGEIV